MRRSFCCNDGVTVSLAMGSEGFLKAGVACKGVDSEQPGVVSAFGSPPIDSCSSLSRHKDDAGATEVSESPSWNRNNHTSIETTSQREDVCKRLFSKGTDYPPSMISGPLVKKIPRKSGKGSRNCTGSSNKRMRVNPIKDSANELLNNKFNKLDVSSTKCTFPDKSEVGNQKNNYSCKRGDKRNPKVPKSKFDSFSVTVKPSSVCFSASADGVNGLKSDVYDITKHEDELPLDALLDGNYKFTSLGKAKGRKPANLEENVLQSVKKACFILGLSMPKNIPEADTTDMKMPTCVLTSDPSIATHPDIDKRSPINKNLDSDSCRQPNFANGTCRPESVLERLVLPPPLDLKSLLFETEKTPMVFLRNGLPAFAWSYSSGGHYCKTNSESAGKSSAGRSSCHVRWVRIGNIIKAGDAQNSFVDLESLTFDHNLVPSTGKKLLYFQNQLTKSPSLCLPDSQPNPSTSSATCSRALPDAHSPRAVEAAETLVEMANSWKDMKKALQRGAIKANDKRWNAGRRKADASSMGASGKRTCMKGAMSWSGRRSDRPPPTELHLNGIAKPCKISPALNAVSSPSQCKISPAKKPVPNEWSRARGKPD